MNARQAAEILRLQFPEFAESAVSYLGEGCDSSAFEVDRRWVFRFPKRAEVEQQLMTESRVLPVLATQSPFPLPEFSFHGRPSEAFPYRFVGYPKIPGVPAIHVNPRTRSSQHWAPLLGRFLSWLHQFPIANATTLGVPELDVAELIEECREEALEDFDLLNDVTEGTPLERWRSFLEAGCPVSGLSRASAAVLAHCDLAAEHFLFDPTTQELTGVIDWSEVAICDRAIDFAGFFHWGGKAWVDAVLSVYKGPVDDGVLVRAEFLAACRGVGDVAFGLETGRREYIEAGTRALALCIGE